MVPEQGGGDGPYRARSSRRASETGMPGEGERGGAPAAGDEVVANAALTAERKKQLEEGGGQRRREGASVRSRKASRGTGRAEMS